MNRAPRRSAVRASQERWTGADTARTVILIATALAFAVPVLSAAVFGFSLPGQGFTLDPLLEGAARADFWPLLLRSLGLALLSTLGSFALFVPTLLWLHLRAPHLHGVAEGLSVLPMVVPAVALVNGANLAFRVTVPGFLTSLYSLVPFYMLLSMPLVYRALDTGLRATDLRTLVPASTSLGAGPVRTLWSVVLPNMRSALMSAAMLSGAVALGEFALAQLLLHATFPVFLAQIGMTRPRTAAAFSFVTILGTWLLMVVMTRISGTRRPSRTGSGRPFARTTTSSRSGRPVLERIT